MTELEIREQCAEEAGQEWVSGELVWETTHVTTRGFESIHTHPVRWSKPRTHLLRRFGCWCIPTVVRVPDALPQYLHRDEPRA